MLFGHLTQTLKFVSDPQEEMGGFEALEHHGYMIIHPPDVEFHENWISSQLWSG